MATVFVGNGKNFIRPIPIRKHARPEQSIYRYGKMVINTVFNNIANYVRDFKKYN